MMVSSRVAGIGSISRIGRCVVKMTKPGLGQAFVRAKISASG